ncbi:MAG: hypothetical protein ACXU9I_06320, partial [Syntrophales bacterium]
EGLISNIFLSRVLHDHLLTSSTSSMATHLSQSQECPLFPSFYLAHDPVVSAQIRMSIQARLNGQCFFIQESELNSSGE